MYNGNAYFKKPKSVGWKNCIRGVPIFLRKKIEKSRLYKKNFTKISRVTAFNQSTPYVCAE